VYYLFVSSSTKADIDPLALAVGVDLAELDELRRRLTRINSAALAGGALNL